MSQMESESPGCQTCIVFHSPLYGWFFRIDDDLNNHHNCFFMLRIIPALIRRIGGNQTVKELVENSLQIVGACRVVPIRRWAEIHDLVCLLIRLMIFEPKETVQTYIKDCSATDCRRCHANLNTFFANLPCM